MKNEIVNLKKKTNKQNRTVEEKFNEEEEEEGKLTKEFEAQDSVFLPSLYLRL